MYKKVRGSALITALFIVTIISIIVTSMLTKLRIDIHHANITINNDKLYLASQAVTYWAIEQVKQEKSMFKALDNQGKVLVFPSKLSKIYPDVTTHGAVYDLQARFNLNNLSDETYKPIFYQLINEIDSNIKKQKRLNIVEATTNWINSSNPNQVRHDEWLDKYLKLNPPYLPAYQKMQSVSEFRAVYGIDDKIYNSLQPYIIALPELSAINVNTASEYLLNSLSMEPQQKTINEILNIRKNKVIKNISQIAPLLNAAKISQNKLSVTSNYYLVVGHTSMQDMTLISYTTIKTIENKDKSIRVDIIQKSFNTE